MTAIVASEWHIKPAVKIYTGFRTEVCISRPQYGVPAIGTLWSCLTHRSRERPDQVKNRRHGPACRLAIGIEARRNGVDQGRPDDDAIRAFRQISRLRRCSYAKTYRYGKICRRLQTRDLGMNIVYHGSGRAGDARNGD